MTAVGPAFADPTPSPADSTGSPLLEPTSTSAMLNLLGEQGVDYTPTTDVAEALADAAFGTTLVIDEGEHLSAASLQQLTDAGFGRVVILNNDSDTVGAFLPTVTVDGSTSDLSAPLSPSCATPDTMAAGTIQLFDSSATFSDSAASGSVDDCYPVQGGKPTFVSGVGVNGSTYVLALGSAAFFENEHLAVAGNAALALHVFGASRTLIWLAPSFTPDPSLNNCAGAGCGGGSDGGSGGRHTPAPGSTTTIPAGGGGGGGGGGSNAGQQTLTSLMPSWIWWVLLQLLVAVLLTAYWRGRRLGAVVTEQLPVTVRAAETVEGHARLYRRANAHGRAAELLRKATASRLAGYFGVPAARANADPSLLIAPIAARLGVGPDLVADLLAGEAPQSEAELVLLADHLDQLEQEVRSS
ncbi:MAG: DUF4350 domain-containing protein [Actinocrinis sp.]